MCGIAGIVGPPRPDRQALREMLARLDHRGPDQCGYYLGPDAGLGNTRLSIVDVAGGAQPIANETDRLLIVMNGEIFNHPELREELLADGHRFRTHTDTEVALHLFEKLDLEFVHKLNGQFAIAIWDKLERRLVLVRDRPGIRPLYYYWSGKRLVFASEIKAIFADPTVPRALNPAGIDQIFTFWTMVGDTTCFKEIRQLPPGHTLELHEGRLDVRRYWDYPLRSSDESEPEHSDDWYVEALREQLTRAVRLRLRADVSVGAYLSGGIDSSAIAFLAQQCLSSQLKTYSVEFTDELLDESVFQHAVATHLATDHRSIRCDLHDVGSVFPAVVRHTEQPLFRTAPAPLFLLSDLVHRDGIKVVLTGEGSDEVLWGYDLFKEAKIRRFWSRHPESRWRPLLFRLLYSHHPAHRSDRYFHLMVDFYRQGLLDTENPYYSHLTRWSNSISQKAYYSAEFASSLEGYDAIGYLDSLIPPNYAGMSDNEKVQYLECHTLLAGYLLSSQGDRMSMAHSVEGRYPFLDHEFIEFCARLPARCKLRLLRDKRLLRKAFESCLPASVTARAKHAYQAPEIPAFTMGNTLVEYAAGALSPSRIQEAGVFDEAKVTRLVDKAMRRGAERAGTRNNMAFVQILSTQLLYDMFIKDPVQLNGVPRECYDVAIEE